MFADDTKCYKTITQPSNSTQLQHNINCLCRGSTNSNINFNYSKIVQLSFKPWTVSSTYTIGSSKIKNVDKHSDLGVIYSPQTFLGSHTTSTSPPRPISYWGYSVEAFHKVKLHYITFSILRNIDLKYSMHCSSLMVQYSPTKLTV